MAANSENIQFAPSQSTSQVHGDPESVQVVVCSLCQKALYPDNEMTNDLASTGVCGDCKFLLLEDFGNHTVTQSSRRRLRGRFRRDSSESVENNLSQPIPHVVNAGRQHQSIASADDDQPVDGEISAWSMQYASAHTTPSGSRRWRQVLSDTDSDGFDNWSSIYGENESSASFRRYRIGETDSFSLSAYGGDSDISMDTHSFVGTGMFNLPDEGDEFDSDTDIDPMHAGLSQWNSDDVEDDEEEEEDENGEEDEEEEDEEEEEEEVDEEEREWELAQAEEAETPAHLQIFFTSSPREGRDHINWEQRFNSAESEGMFSRIIRDTWQALEGSDLPLPHGANFGDYLDARGFEDLLEHLAENDSSRRGAPPAGVSFVNNLPRVVIGKEHEKHDELVCAICQEVLAPGTEVNQLPCFHLYHINCILPWLSARNSCPLCREELPTDDKDYEEGKQNIDGRNMIPERQQLDVMDDSSSDVSDGTEVNEEDGSSQGDVSNMNSSTTRSGRGRWFFLAAAPIVGLVGIVLVLWLGNNSQIEGSRYLGGHYLSGQNQHAVHAYASPNQRESRSRRWWCPF